MNLREYQQMRQLEDAYWWFVGRRAIIGKLLHLFPGAARQRRLLDLGCGTGANLALLGRYGRVFGLDISPEALGLAAHRDRRQPLAEGLANCLPFRDATFDVITALDVVEHVEDDCGALREVRRLLRADGRFILTVPAFQWLWSEHDEALGHYRRYSKTALIRTLVCAGLEPLFISFAICLPIIPTAALRLLQRFARSPRRDAKTAHIILPPVLNRALITYLELEAFILPHMRIPFGVSLIAVTQPAADA